MTLDVACVPPPSLFAPPDLHPAHISFQWSNKAPAAFLTVANGVIAKKRMLEASWSMYYALSFSSGCLFTLEMNAASLPLGCARPGLCGGGRRAL